MNLHKRLLIFSVMWHAFHVLRCDEAKNILAEIKLLPMLQHITHPLYWNSSNGVPFSEIDFLNAVHQNMLRVAQQTRNTGQNRNNLASHMHPQSIRSQFEANSKPIRSDYNFCLIAMSYWIISDIVCTYNVWSYRQPQIFLCWWYRVWQP